MNDDLISRQAAIDALMKRDKELRNINWYDKPFAEGECRGIDYALEIVNALPSVQSTQSNAYNALKTLDCIDRQAAIDALSTPHGILYPIRTIEALPSAQPERKWIPCSNPPKHHKDVIVRGIEAIGNTTVHKVMQWDVDTWRPTDYAPSVMWKEWSEIQ